MNRLVQAGPVAVEARYDRGRVRVVVRLDTGLELAFAPRAMQGLERTTAMVLDTIKISASGLGQHFPKLDADLYVTALLEDRLGSRQWMAACRQEEWEGRCGITHRFMHGATLVGAADGSHGITGTELIRKFSC